MYLFNEQLIVIAAIIAFILWLSLFIYLILDHVFYVNTYGKFLLNLESININNGDIDNFLKDSRTFYIKKYISKSNSDFFIARKASFIYINRRGYYRVLHEAENSSSKNKKVALFALSRVSDFKILEILEEMLSSDNFNDAYSAYDMLGMFDNLPAAKILLKAIDDKTLSASRITSLLENFKVNLNDLYIENISNDKSKYWSIYLLGRSSYKNSLIDDVIYKETFNSDPSIRKVSISALSEFGSTRTFDRAKELLDDPSFFVKTQSIRILFNFNNAEVMDRIINLLNDDNSLVKTEAKNFLIYNSNEALDFLKKTENSKYIEMAADVINSINIYNGVKLP